MRVVVQRVSRAAVRVDGATVGEIGAGLLALVGVTEGDGEAEAERLADKIAGLRIFSDVEGRFNESIAETGGAVLVVSQFTLISDVRKGRRPGFTRAARPEQAEPLVERFASHLEAAGVPVARGRFGAEMEVALVNAGPFTIVIDSAELQRPRRQ